MRSFTFICLFIGIFTQEAMTQENNIQKQVNQIGISINQDLSSFTQGVNQWLSGQMTDAQSTYLVKNSLVPLVRNLTRSYAKTLRLANQVPNQYGSREVQMISNQGVSVFADWDKLLSQMVDLDAQQRYQELHAVANQYLQPAIRQTEIFIQQSIQISQQLAQGVLNHNNNVPHTQNYNQQQQNYYNNQTMNIMQQNMQSSHETSMAIINNMAPDPVDIYDANGAYLGTD